MRVSELMCIMGPEQCCIRVYCDSELDYYIPDTVVSSLYTRSLTFIMTLGGLNYSSPFYQGRVQDSERLTNLPRVSL